MAQRSSVHFHDRAMAGTGAGQPHLSFQGQDRCPAERGEECTIGISGIQPSLGKLWGQTTAPGGLEGGASRPGGLLLNPEISQSLPS